MTKRQRAFARAKAQGLNDADAAREAGYSESVALKAGTKIASNVQVQAYYRHVIQTVAPPKRVIEKISELIEGKSVTTKVVRTKVPVVDRRGRISYRTKTRLVKTETVDLGASLRAIAMVMEIAGYLPSKGPAVPIKTEEQIHRMTDAEIEPRRRSEIVRNSELYLTKS